MAVMDLRTQRERCGQALPNGSPDARICTFGCTDGILAVICPNCDGNLILLPSRPSQLLRKCPLADA